MTAREAELWISQMAGVDIDDTAMRDKIMNMIERAIREAVEAEREAIIDHLNGKKGVFINRDFVVEHIRARGSK